MDERDKRGFGIWKLETYDEDFNATEKGRDSDNGHLVSEFRHVIGPYSLIRFTFSLEYYSEVNSAGSPKVTLVAGMRAISSLTLTECE